jgi:hypothetical protein
VAGRQSACGSTDQSDNSWPWSSVVLHKSSSISIAQRPPACHGLATTQKLRRNEGSAATFAASKATGAEAKGSVVMPYRREREPGYFGHLTAIPAQGRDRALVMNTAASKTMSRINTPLSWRLYAAARIPNRGCSGRALRREQGRMASLARPCPVCANLDIPT